MIDKIQQKTQTERKSNRNLIQISFTRNHDYTRNQHHLYIVLGVTPKATKKNRFSHCRITYLRKIIAK